MNFEDRDTEMYMDNASTTLMSPDVLEEMMPYLEERYGNPETHYHLGREAREAVDKAAERVAILVGCTPEQVLFTSGGSEANNWAIKGIDCGVSDSIIVGSTEHASVLEPARYRQGNGEDFHNVFEVPVDADGVVDVASIEKKLKKGDVSLVSVQYANNETGTIQPTAEIADLCKKNGAVFHADAVQAAGKMPIDMEDDGVDMLTLSAHKIHGPMGIGALCVADGVDLEPLIHGGAHQGGLRAGTLPVAQIVGFGKAAEMACSWKGEMKRVREIRNKIILSLKERMGAIINGGEHVLPSIISFTLSGVEASAVCGILCERHGACVSTGAACSRGKDSHVLEAMGISGVDGRSTFRISLSVTNQANDGILIVDKLQAAIRQSKEMGLL